MVVHCLNFFFVTIIKLTRQYTSYELQNAIKHKRTYRIHKIDEYIFLNIELKYYIPSRSSICSCGTETEKKPFSFIHISEKVRQYHHSSFLTNLQEK
jgi:hypothetical protein